jgi:hypothetical protein
VLDNPEDKDGKLFAKAKNNLGRDTKTLRYGKGVKRARQEGCSERGGLQNRVGSMAIPRTCAA